MDFGNLKLLDLIAKFKENVHLIKDENLRKFANLGIELLDLFVNNLKKLDATDDQINQAIENDNELPKIDVSEGKPKSKIVLEKFLIQLVKSIPIAVGCIKSCFSKNGNEKNLNVGASILNNKFEMLNIFS